MFEELLRILHKVNQGELIEASKNLLEILKNSEEEEELMKLAYYLEKELREMRDEESFYLSSSPFSEEFRNIIKEMNKIRERKLKILIFHALYKLSKGNIIIMNMINISKIDVKPNTYI